MWLLQILGYIAIPAAYLLHWLLAEKSFEPIVTFILAAIGVIPLAHLMGQATEQLSERTGPTWGGLLNATFGNAAELIIGIIALSKGYNEIVKASLTGSILGNLLLVAGGAMLVGGWKREKQSFSRPAAEANAGMLVMAVAAMLLPAIFDFTYRTHDKDFTDHSHALTLGTSVILMIVYGLGLLFALRTHRHLFSRGPAIDEDSPSGMGGLHGVWTVKHSVIVLLLASVGIAFVAELLVGSAELMATRLGWNQVFVGVVLLAIIGNAAEHSTALQLARRNDMDTAMTIAYQSSLQIALFATPLLVFIAAAMAGMNVHNAHFMDLIFSPMEVIAVILSVAIVVVLNQNGESNWFEGALLLAMYAILSIAFFYIPRGVGHG